MPSLLTDKKITINMTRKAEYNRKNLVNCISYFIVKVKYKGMVNS